MKMTRRETALGGLSLLGTTVINSAGASTSTQSTLQTAIAQNTRANNTLHPAGVPSSYDWYNGTNTVFGNTPPSNFTAMTGWGQIYPIVGATNVITTTRLANFNAWVLLNTGVWVQVQAQANDPLGGAHFVADFSSQTTIAWNKTVNADGSITVDSPPNGYNTHYWPTNRGTYTAGTVVGAFASYDVSMTDPTANLIANCGVDWWLDNVVGAPTSTNNAGSGMSNWVQLTTQPQTLYFSSLSPQALENNPPPGLGLSCLVVAPGMFKCGY